MREHLRIYRWEYRLCALLIIVPMVMAWTALLPPLDVATAKAFLPLLQKQFEREHPGITPIETEKLPDWDQLNNNKWASVETMSSYAGMGQVFAAFMQAEVSSESLAMKPLLDQINEFNARNEVLLPMFAASKTVPNFLSYQVMAKFQRLLAEQSEARHDWDGALLHLRQCAAEANASRWDGLIGQLIAIATRAIGYAGYQELARTEAPAPVLRQALADLAALESTEPRFDRWVEISERSYFIKQAADGFKMVPVPTGDMADYNAKPKLRPTSPHERQEVFQAAMWAAVATVVSQRDKLREPALRSGAEYYSREAALDSDGEPHDFRFSLARRFSWTRVCVARQWMRKVIAREPWVLNPFGLPEDEIKKLDPWTLAMLSSSSFIYANVLEAKTRCGVMHGYGELARAAIAMKLYHAEHGQWPANIDEVAKAYPETHTTATLHMGWLAMDTPEMKWLLWGKCLPLRGLEFEEKQAARNAPPDQIDMLDDRTPGLYRWQTNPLPVVIAALALQTHPALVEYADVGISEGDSSSIKPDHSQTLLDWHSQSAFYLSSTHRDQRWFRLDPALAERVSDANLKETTHGTELAKLGPVRLRAKLKAPEKALAIWSPGPDGTDDGGRICYDPSNGTTSRGDLITFPESF